MSEIKTGARNNVGDRAAIRQVRGLAGQIVDITKTLEPNDEDTLMDETMDDAVVMQGGAVKALGDGKIGGYLILWGDAEHTDLENEFFDAKTDLGYSTKCALLYHHGLDIVERSIIVSNAASRSLCVCPPRT